VGSSCSFPCRPAEAPWSVVSAAPGSFSRTCTPSSAPAPRRQLRHRTVMGRTADRSQHRGWPSIRRHRGLEVDLFCLSWTGCIDLVLPTAGSSHEPRSALTYHHGHDHERSSSRPPCARATLPTHPPFFVQASPLDPSDGAARDCFIPFITKHLHAADSHTSQLCLHPHTRSPMDTIQSSAKKTES
jgi:hypothetical protein